MESLKGNLLIAVPRLPDANFFRTVVLILRHDEQGALGLVLNRPSTVTVCDVWKTISGHKSDIQDLVYMGGPVQGPLIALHSSFSLAESDVIPGVYYSVHKDQLNELVESQREPLKVFTGNSGWGPGQLDNEVAAGGWFVMPAEQHHLFESDDQLWKLVCESYGNEILVEERFRSKIPSDPSLN